MLQRTALEILEVMMEGSPFHSVHGVAGFLHPQRHHGRATAEYADLIGLENKMA